MSKEIASTAGHNDFLKEFKQRIKAAQYEALKYANKEMIQLCWGKSI
jgi:hypothetical protein